MMRRARAAYQRAARTEAKDRIARGGPVLFGLRALTLLMKLDVVLFGRVKSGPFFALLEKRTDEPRGTELTEDAWSRRRARDAAPAGRATGPACGRPRTWRGGRGRPRGLARCAARREPCGLGGSVVDSCRPAAGAR